MISLISFRLSNLQHLLLTLSVVSSVLFRTTSDPSSRRRWLATRLASTTTTTTVSTATETATTSTTLGESTWLPWREHGVLDTSDLWPPNIITCWCQLIGSMNIKSFRMAFDSQQGIMGLVVPVNPPSRAIQGPSRTNFQLPVKQNQNVKVQFYRNGLFLLGV